jgi:prepilin-type N-terminal cleavage/methylation domain-containing protein
MRLLTQTRSLARRGFTLIELVVVIAILVILSSLILPKLDLFKLKAGKGAACANMAGVTRYVEGYRISKDLFPNFWDSMLDSTTPTALYSHLHPELLGPALSGMPGASQKLVLTTITTDLELRSLNLVGITSVHDHDVAMSYPSDSAANTTPRTLAVGDSIATLNAADPGAQETLANLYPQTGGTVPAGKKVVVFGLGPANGIVGSQLHDAPTYPNADHVTIYCRFLCAFEISDDGKDAKLLGTLGADGDPLEGEIADYYTQG